MNPNLVILAAGKGSRYGGLKQMDSLGPAGEAILDYSVYDALKVGFGKIIFVVRQNILNDFRTFISYKYKDKIDISFAIQPDAQSINPDRSKPWGTGQAILAVENEMDRAFAVINADDFYGKQAFNIAYNFLTGQHKHSEHCMVGYQLKSTLSDHGTVSRGRCFVNGQNKLTGIKEMQQVWKENGKTWFQEENKSSEIPGNTIVSMNFWCFQKEILTYFKEGFDQFLFKNRDSESTEFLIPEVINNAITDQNISVSVFKSEGPWFGITHKNDKRLVIEKLARLTDRHTYPSPLWE